MRIFRLLILASIVTLIALGACRRQTPVNTGLQEAKGYPTEGHRVGPDLDGDGIPNDMAWIDADPLKVYSDPSFPAIHQGALAQAVKQMNDACFCRLLDGPTTGEPIFKQEVSGAPDRGTIYVRDDGKFDPNKAHTDPYTFPDGRIFSAEVIIPQQGVDHDGIWARQFSQDEIRRMILHELGHSVGMAHSQDPHSFMYPVMLDGQSITEADRKLLYKVYGGKI